MQTNNNSNGRSTVNTKRVHFGPNQVVNYHLSKNNLKLKQNHYGKSKEETLSIRGAIKAVKRLSDSGLEVFSLSLKDKNPIILKKICNFKKINNNNKPNFNTGYPKGALMELNSRRHKRWRHTLADRRRTKNKKPIPRVPMIVQMKKDRIVKKKKINSTDDSSSNTRSES